MTASRTNPVDAHRPPALPRQPRGPSESECYPHPVTFGATPVDVRKSHLFHVSIVMAADVAAWPVLESRESEGDEDIAQAAGRRTGAPPGTPEPRGHRQ